MVAALYRGLFDLVARTIAELDFSRLGWGAQEARLLARAIPDMASLTSCDVRDNTISGDGASQLAAAVLSNAKIEKFDDSPIKEMRADSLTTLDMHGKGIGLEGSLVVAGLMPFMASLTSLR